MKPKVAVLLSTYNGERFLLEQLNSILSQTYTPIDIFIRDDGSSDNTLSLLESFSSEHSQTTLFQEQNLGAAQSFFSLLAKPLDEYDYIAFSDQDDVWDPFKIEDSILKLKVIQSDTPAMYCSRFEIVSESLTHLAFSPVYHTVGFHNALVQNIATGCTVVINQAARQLILSQLPDQVIMHDWWIYLVVSAFGKVIYDPQSYVKYRQHQSNVVGTTSTFIGKMKRHWKSFRNGKSVIFKISGQATTFYSIFGSRLMPENKRLLELFLLGKSSVLGRFRLLFNRQLKRNSIIDNAILRIMISLNKY
ncbi:MAG: glycosyltransferase family 2 protein [Chloroherpetonaceae bacterium]|nr:glycosyltransferase family 2 protein [Chloroherpetonaceae bacterium]